MTGRRGEMGFTLVETLVGMAIMSAALIISYSTISNALNTAFRLSERMAAVEEVQLTIEALRQQPFIRARSFEGETTAYGWRIFVKSVKGPLNRSVVAFRIVGQIVGKREHSRFETVADTIITGPGA